MKKKVCLQFNLAPSTLSTIIKNEQKLWDEYERNCGKKPLKDWRSEDRGEEEEVEEEEEKDEEEDGILLSFLREHFIFLNL